MCSSFVSGSLWGRLFMVLGVFLVVSRCGGGGGDPASVSGETSSSSDIVDDSNGQSTEDSPSSTGDTGGDPDVGGFIRVDTTSEWDGGSGGDSEVVIDTMGDTSAPNDDIGGNPGDVSEVPDATITFCGDGTCSLGEDCDGCPEDCGNCPTVGSCCQVSALPGCSSTDVEECTCALDIYCCDVEWDILCIAAAQESCGLVCSGTCGDADCGDSEDCTNCPADCGLCVGCGDGICDAPENCDNCSTDCGECPPPEWTGSCCEAKSTPGCEDFLVADCVCALDTTCCTGPWGKECTELGLGACGLQCGGSCGDGSCDDGESCTSCPNDCGACVTCGNGSCDVGESCSSCPNDCGACITCGNGSCDDGESCTSCPGDCGACVACGNGKVDVGEECEVGQSTTCEALGGLGGAVLCNPDSCVWSDNACTPCTPTTVGCPGGPVCDQGLCCNPSTGQYQPKGTACGDAPLSVQTQCLGNNVQERVAVFGCSGTTALCSNLTTNWVWSPWQTVKTCKSEEYCTTAKGVAECIVAECTSGTCCSTATKTFKSQGSKCGTAVTTTERACAGNSIVERKAYDGCSGKAATCSTAPADWSYTGWTVVESCAGGTSCKVVDSQPVCMGESLCTSGPCCDVAKQAFKPVGALCADASAQKILGWIDMKCNGAQKQEREGYRGCSGKGAQCSLWEGHAFWEPWKTTETCVSSGHCLEVTAQQDTNMAGGSHYKKAFCAPKYTNGTAACYAGTDTFSPAKPYASKCGDTPLSWQVRCIDGKAQMRPIYPGCAFSGTYGCTGASYGPWQVKEDCGPGKFCFQYLGGENLTAAQAQTFSGYKCLSTSQPASCSVTGAICGTGPVNELFSCDANTNSIVRIYAVTTCAANGTCPGTYSGSSKWSVMWEPVKSCGATALCEVCGANVTIPGAPGGAWLKSSGAMKQQPKCEPLLSDFTPGGLCSDCQTGSFDPLGTPCFNTPNTSQYICQGNDIWRRQGFYTCDGAGTCGTAAAAIAWGEYEFYQACSNLQVCTEVSSSKSAYCKFKENLVGCGQACDASTICTAGTCLAGKCQSTLCQQCVDQGLECDMTTSCGFYKCKTTGGGGPGEPGGPGGPDLNGCYPLEGTISKKNFSIEGVNFADFTILYSVDSFIGEPLFFGTYKFTTVSKGVTLSPYTKFYLNLKVGAVTKSIMFSPVVPVDASGEWGFQVKQSPSWQTAFCDPVDPAAGCLDTAAAKEFYKAPPCVTGFTVVFK